MKANSLDALGDLVKNLDPRICGPRAIEYGFGFDPTLTFWIGNRRLHLYWGWKPTQMKSEGAAPPRPYEPPVVEVAQWAQREADTVVRRCYICEEAELEDIAQRFLCGGVPVVELSGYRWLNDGLDHDKFIPHPPDVPIPGYIADWFDGQLG